VQLKRQLVLEAVKHIPRPPSATPRPDGLYDLSLELSEVFHQGYIDQQGIPPEAGTNPLFDQYRQLLDPSTDYLKWRSIGVGDHKKSSSQTLGRSFARAYLSLQGYTWFVDIKDLEQSPSPEWTATRLHKGEMPDWIVGTPGDHFAVAEAKGKIGKIGKGPTQLTKWREQLANVALTRNGSAATIEKGWLIATPWVMSDQIDEPRMYAEDPLVPGDFEPSLEDRLSLNQWLAKRHTIRNLLRLGKSSIALRAEISRTREEKTSSTTWRCNMPGMEGLTFVGRPIGGFSKFPWFPMDWRFIRDYMGFPSRQWERWAQVWTAAMEEAMESTWFDGVAVSTVSSVVAGGLPKRIEVPDGLYKEQAFTSLLPDGSLLAPMAFMKPSESVEF
jgi:hypothetical protein